jgi:transcriptional regulator with XRE-family HTH domain
VAPRRPRSVRARQLAAELRRVRAAAFLTGDEVAARLGWSPSKLSRIETGHTAITMPDLRQLLETYQVSGPLHERLVELGRADSQRGWWDAYDDTLPGEIPTLLALEDEAEAELSYTQIVVPGLLQTEAYATAIMRSLNIPPGEIARRVSVRLTRQRVLAKDNPIELIAVLDEACLRRQVGGTPVMEEQLSHIITMAELPNVALHVLPFSAGYHEGLASSFTVLHFPEEGAADVVYLEHMTSDLFIEQEGDVYRYIRAFDGLRELALGHQESITSLRQIASEIQQTQGG